MSNTIVGKAWAAGALAAFWATDNVMAKGTHFAHKMLTDSVQFQTPKRECKGGFELVGEVCRKLESMAATISCNRGWKLVDGMCIRKKTIVAAPVCPPNFTWDGKECVRWETAVEEYGCPEGCTPSKGMCLLLNYEEPIQRCPRGYRANAEGMCFTETRNKADTVCPDGYFPSKYGCSTIIEEPVKLKCPHHYELREKECVLEDRAAVKISCMDGFLFDEVRGDCVRRLHHLAMEVCAGNYVYDPVARICVLFTKKDAAKGCREGFTMTNGVCSQTIIEEPHLQCDQGETLEGNQCVINLIEQPKYACKESLELVDGVCVEVQRVPGDVTCPQGLELIKGECVLVKFTKPVEFCLKGYTLCDNTCRKMSRANPEHTCSEGELRGNKCVGYLTVEAVFGCKRGTLENKQCVVAIETPLQRTCPSGFTKRKDGFCSQKLIHEAFVQCPEGAVKIRKHHCESIAAEDPQLSCHKHFTLVGKSCQKVLEVFPITVCHSGWKLKEGQCIKVSRKPQICLDPPCI